MNSYVNVKKRDKRSNSYCVLNYSGWMHSEFSGSSWRSLDEWLTNMPTGNVPVTLEIFEPMYHGKQVHMINEESLNELFQYMKQHWIKIHIAV